MGHINIVHKIFVDPSMTYIYKMGHKNIGHKIFVDPSMTYMYKMGHMNIEHKIFVLPFCVSAISFFLDHPLFQISE